MQFVWTRLDSAIFSLCLTRAINFCYFDIRIDRANFGRFNIQLTQISTLTNTNRIKIVEKLSIRLCVVLCVGKNIQMANCDDDDAAAAENGTSIVHRLEFFFVRCRRCRCLRKSVFTLWPNDAAQQIGSLWTVVFGHHRPTFTVMRYQCRLNQPPHKHILAVYL